jgi:hypothetical protein
VSIPGRRLLNSVLRRGAVERRGAVRRPCRFRGGERSRFPAAVATKLGNGQSRRRWHSLPQLRHRGGRVQFARRWSSPWQLKHLPLRAGGTGLERRVRRRHHRLRLSARRKPSASGAPENLGGCVTIEERRRRSPASRRAPAPRRGLLPALGGERRAAAMKSPGFRLRRRRRWRRRREPSAATSFPFPGGGGTHARSSRTPQTPPNR